MTPHQSQVFRGRPLPYTPILQKHSSSPGEMLYQDTLCTTVPQRIRNKDPHAVVKCERLEDQVALSAANYDHRGCWQKALLFAGQMVSIFNNARTYWIPTTVVQVTDLAPTLNIIGGGEYRQACDHIHQHHHNAVKPDKHTPMAIMQPSAPTMLVAAPQLPCPSNTPASCSPKPHSSSPPSGRCLPLQMYPRRLVLIQ